MSGYQHILWATDLFDENVMVGERAAALAQHYGARLSLLHVVDNLPLYFGHEMVVPDTEKIEQMLESKAKEKIATFAARFGLDEADAHVEVDMVKLGILSFVEQHHVDLIVMGSHSRKGIAHLLGSTTRAVLDSASCDVLAVRMR